MTSHRISAGGLIDRSKKLEFTFDGRPYAGFQGDTLASALMANGVRIMGRSFKYHRPRGVWGAWFDDPNAIFNVSLNGRELPNCSATTTQLESGMSAHSVNAFPSAQFDIKGGLDLFHRWLGAGFYYKTFMWPDWHLFEPMIRKMAGLGALDREVLSDFTSDQSHATCQTLVIGGGAAGLTAARTAAENGQNVVLVDDHPELGGGLYAMGQIENMQPTDWIAEQVAAIKAAGGRVLTTTTAFGVYDHQLIGLSQNTGFSNAPRLIRMRAERIVMATGALDRPVTFANNDRPGVMSLAGAEEFIGRYGVLVGRDVAVLSNNSLAESAVRRLKAEGAKVTVLDPIQGGVRALGGKRLKGVEVAGKRYPADAVLVSGGLTPIVHLWRHAGGKLDWSDSKQAFIPGKAPGCMSAIGAANGTFDLEAVLEEARAIGLGRSSERPDNSTYTITPLWPEAGSKGRQWIDFQHDVTLKDVELAARENYVSVEHLKRYTTLGMASDQGKTSNMSGLAAMAAIQGRAIPEVGTTTFRPPFVPVPLELYHGHHGGQLLHPPKRLTLEPIHRAANAALGEYGGWLRPGWYGSGKAETHIHDEVLMARDAGAILDASPLGKIEVMGPDAEAFVNFIYYNTIQTLKPGHIRYGFMLTEKGVVYDDGVVARLGQGRFVISCSSSHVDGVRMSLESWRQDGNDPDKIFVHDTTQNWATVTVTGPNARAVVGALKLDIDLSAEAFAHMTFREAEFDGVPLRVARVSFTGDTSFELSIRPSAVSNLWQILIEAGKPLGVGPLGVEALSVLRAEKGYLIIGKDTDGETMPHDLGFGIPRQKKRAAFVGDRSLHIDVANDPERRQFVGLEVPSDVKPLATGAHLVTEGENPKSIGIVTSSYHSPTLGRSIALGLLVRGASRHGETVRVWHLGESTDAVVCSPCFYDPEGVRLNA